MMLIEIARIYKDLVRCDFYQLAQETQINH